MRLRIESVNGSPMNDYRIQEGSVHVRVLEPNGRPYASPLGCWRVLDEEDIQLHHALGTVVSEWLRKRSFNGVSHRVACCM
jgi:hypothetical protein